MELELELNCAESGNRMIEPLQLMVDDRDTIDDAVAWEPGNKAIHDGHAYDLRQRFHFSTEFTVCLKLLCTLL